jgi:tetratricopeptide (TPR) repeat protein
LALLSKAMAITLPLILIAIDYFYEHKPLKLCFKGKTLFFLIALIFGLFSLVIRIQAQDLLVGRLVNLAHNLNIAAFSILFYLNKLILPVNLSCLYPYPYNDTVFFNQTAIFNYSLLVVLSAGLVILSKYSRKIIFGVFFFLITILPVIQLIPSSGSMSVVFDRYLYLPSVGLFYALALILYWIYAKEYKYTVVVRRFIQVILVVIIAIFSALTYQRSFVWRNSLSLWNDVIKKYPGIATAYNSRGVFFMRQGEYELAHTDFLMAIKIKNEQSPGAGLKYYYNLASSLEALGRGQEAKALIASLEKNKAGN